MVVLFRDKVPQLVVGNTLYIRQINEPVMIFQAKRFTSIYYNRVMHVLTALLWSNRSDMSQLTYSFGYVLGVNSRLWSCLFLKFHTRLEANSATSFQNDFNKYSRVLNLLFSRNSSIPEHRHILGYNTTKIKTVTSPGARFSKAPESFRALKANFKSP